MFPHRLYIHAIYHDHPIMFFSLDGTFISLVFTNTIFSHGSYIVHVCIRIRAAIVKNERIRFCHVFLIFNTYLYSIVCIVCKFTLTLKIVPTSQ